MQHNFFGCVESKTKIIMGEIDFDRSSQSKYWMFDEDSLLACRQEACNNSSTSNREGGKPRIRKFACGYHGKQSTTNTHTDKERKSADTSAKISPKEQETLIHFHAHQIQKLIGPNAIFPMLKRGASVLSTAIMLFRKFYLSNSVIDFHPRHIAAASALLAVKTDCERNLPIDVLSHATLVVEMRAQNDPLSMDELRAVTIQEIEAAERALLEGCDYRLRSHHPYGAIKVLASDVASYFSALQEQNEFTFKSMECGSIYSSPRSVMHELHSFHNCNDDHVGLDTLCERALSIAQYALVYSDINFLFPPGQIAFAAIALALDSHAYTGDDDSPTCNRLGEKMRKYMSARFSQKSNEEVSEYEQQVSKIISTLENCSSIDLEMFSPFWQFHQRRYAKTAERQAIKIRKAIFTASRLRVISHASFQITSPVPSRSPSPPTFGYYRQPQHPPCHTYSHHYQPRHHFNNHQQFDFNGGQRKRRRDEEEYAWTPEDRYHNRAPYHHGKIARVTPINTPFL